MDPDLAARPAADQPPDRPPLDLQRLREEAPGWATVEVLASCPSTNVLVAERARAGAAPGLVVVTEHQTAGRGRLDRSWVTPPRAALTFSVLLRPGVPDARWPWAPLVAGLAVLDGIAAAAGPPASLKWPNDVLCGGLKVAGLLAERVHEGSGPPALVLGIGLNVTTTAAELPVATATSLALAGWSRPDRTALLLGLLEALGRRYAAWESAGGDARAGLAEEYERRCATVGTDVRVLLPDGTQRHGRAVGVDADGSLVVDGPSGRAAVSVGDVLHVRVP